MSSTEILIGQLNTIGTTILMVISIINFFFGIIGLIFNVFVFTRPSLRRQPCTFYFLSSTCFNFFVILIILPVRILSNIYNINGSDYNIVYCKIQAFLFYAIRTISCWLIGLATIDRYLHSSSNTLFRQMSSLKTAKITIGITVIFISGLYSHMIVYYNMSYTFDQFGNVVSTCNAEVGTYRTFLSLWFMIFYSLLPSFFMLLFGFLTVKNLRQRRQIIPRAAETNSNNRRTDSQLLRMLAAQVLVIIICTLPVTGYRLYGALTVNVTKDKIRLAQENLASQIVSAMTYFAHSSSFYLYTLSGTIFRKELLKNIKLHWPFNQNQTQTNSGGTLPNNNVFPKTTSEH